MSYEQYLKQRTEKMNLVQSLIDEGKLDEANAEMENVKSLDESWDAISKAQANARALADEQRKVVGVENLGGVSVENGTATATVSFGTPENLSQDEKMQAMFKSESYKNAWAKTMMGKELTDEENNIVSMVNAYTHTTENTGVVIPETVSAGIWDLVEEMYPLWNDVQKTYVKGNYNAPISDESTEAKWYDEETSTEDGKETFKELALTGCELARAITVSWKLREMSIEDFIPFIQRKLARKMGAGLGYGTSHGKGKPTANEHKPEPMGIVTALEKEGGTPQIKTYTLGTLAYKDITAARALVKVGASELKVYANNTTIWTELANVVDGKGNPLFLPDVVENRTVYRILGMEVKEDDSMKDGEVLLSSPYVGYLANVNKEISLMSEEHIKARTVDYCGYAIVDGGVTSTKAHALLKGE